MAAARDNRRKPIMPILLLHVVTRVGNPARGCGNNSPR